MPETMDPAVVTLPNTAVKAIASQLGDTAAKHKADKERLIYLVSSLKGKKAVVDPELQTAEDVEDYVQEKIQTDKEEEMASGYKMPLLAAGLMAGGYGAKKLGDYALNREDRSAVERLIDLNTRMGDTAPAGRLHEKLLNLFVPSKLLAPEYEGTKDLFYDYIDTASRASRVRPFNQPVVPMIKKIKDLFGLNGKVDPTDPYAVEDANHYPAFVKGPIAAYIHQIKKVPLESESKVNPNPVANIQNFMFSGINPEDRPDPKATSAAIEEKLKEYIGTKGMSMEDAQNLSKVKHSDQMDILRSFPGYLQTKDPKLAGYQNEMMKNLAKSQEWPGSMYAGGSNLALKALQDFPRTVGYVAGGAGLGLAGYWLYLKRKSKLREQEAQVEQEALAEAKRNKKKKKPAVKE